MLKLRIALLILLVWRLASAIALGVLVADLSMSYLVAAVLLGVMTVWAIDVVESVVRKEMHNLRNGLEQENYHD